MKMRGRKRCTAIILAAGQGKRMGTAVQKQYIELDGKPLIYYPLKVFQDSALIDEIILVAGSGQVSYVQDEIVRKYHFSKVSVVTEGGKERYDSVWRGLKAMRREGAGLEEEQGYVFIHDGARPFVDEAIIKRGYESVKKHKACVAGMPSKDTVKLVDENDFAVKTPERKYVWIVQTPQIFEEALIVEAYSRLAEQECIHVTDDAMVVEEMMGTAVKLYEGSYENIKITTPEDLKIAIAFLKSR